MRNICGEKQKLFNGKLFLFKTSFACLKPNIQWLTNINGQQEW